MTKKLWGVRLTCFNHPPSIVEAYASHSHAESSAAMMNRVDGQRAIVVPCEVLDLGGAL